MSVMLFIVALVTMLCRSCFILTSGINQSQPRSGPKKRESWCEEAEHHLDSNFFLDDYHWWKAEGLQYTCILQNMFMHAEAVGWKKCE